MRKTISPQCKAPRFIYGVVPLCPLAPVSLCLFLTRFLRTVVIESDDHRLMAITKHTTSCDGSLRLRSSTLSVLPIVCAITSGGITVPIALNTRADSITREMKEKTLSLHWLRRLSQGVTSNAT